MSFLEVQGVQGHMQQETFFLLTAIKVTLMKKEDKS